MRIYGMDDVGRRFEHLAELQDLWGSALGILLDRQRAYPHVEQAEQIHDLEIALKMLEYHMTEEFDDTEHQSYYARTINYLPKDAALIKETVECPQCGKTFTLHEGILPGTEVTCDLCGKKWRVS